MCIIHALRIGRIAQVAGRGSATGRGKMRLKSRIRARPPIFQAVFLTTIPECNRARRPGVVLIYGSDIRFDNGLNDMKTKFAALAFFVMTCASAQAESLVDGSADAGQSKSLTCSACHGADGNSVNPEWPSIAGQHAGYAYQQLQAFKSGARVNALMSGQAMILQDQDMRDLAVYFESQVPAARAAADPSTVDKGQAIYRAGDKEDAVSACIACHGPSGRGNPAANYPAIAGQYAVYTAKQLRDYASGARKSVGPVQQMRDIALRLSEEDIEAVASYIQGLH